MRSRVCPAATSHEAAQASRPPELRQWRTLSSHLPNSTTTGWKTRRKGAADRAWSSAPGIAVCAVRVLLGSYTVTIPDFFTILGGGTIESAKGARYIVMEEKLPRAVLGALAGVAFGLGGAIFQLLLRNPIASPDIIGVSNGAAL